MPPFLAVQTLDDPVTLRAVTQASDADLRIQEPHGVSYLRCWVAESAGKIVCLLDASSLDAAVDVHRQAYGLVVPKRFTRSLQEALT